MNRFEAPIMMLANATIALAILTSTTALAAAAPAIPHDEARVVVAQAGIAQSRAPASATIDAFPAYQRGVREAAAQGNEALRRYVWRTRMIYNFRFEDYARD